MTVKEFYNLMVEKGAEDYEFKFRYELESYPVTKEEIEIYDTDKEVII